MSWTHTDPENHKYMDEWWLNIWRDADLPEADELDRLYEQKPVRELKFIHAAAHAYSAMIDRTEWPYTKQEDMERLYWKLANSHAWQSVPSVYVDLWQAGGYGEGEEIVEELYLQYIPHAWCGVHRDEDEWKWPMPHLVIPQDVVEDRVATFCMEEEEEEEEED